MEISRGRGVLKVKIVGPKYDAKLELTGRTEGAKQKPFHGGSMDISWNSTIIDLMYSLITNFI